MHKYYPYQQNHQQQHQQPQQQQQQQQQQLLDETVSLPVTGFGRFLISYTYVHLFTG